MHTHISKDFSHVMVDLETLGLTAKAPIISIGAVLFNLTDMDTPESLKDPNRCFYEEIITSDWFAYGRQPDPETIAWWMNQSTDAKTLFKPSAEKQSAYFAYISFNAFAFRKETTSVRRGLWSNGANFDVVLLQDWAKAIAAAGHNVTYQSQYNMEYDVRTVVKLATDLTGFNKKDFKFEGTYHNALDDARNQVLLVQECCRRLNPNKTALQYVETVEPVQGFSSAPSGPIPTPGQAAEALFINEDIISLEDRKRHL